MSDGSAGSMYWPLDCGFLHCVNRSSLNTSWIIHPSGRSSWNAPWPISFKILKDPYLFWSSFFESLFKWIFLAFSHTLSLVFNPCIFLLFLSNCYLIASFAISIDFVASSQLLYSPMRKFSSFDNSIYIVRFPFYRYLPKLSLNRVLPIAICLLSLYWNSVAANHSIQLFYW